MPFGSDFTTTTLFMAGPEPATMPLTVLGPIPVSGSLSLFSPGPPANSLSLWIGKDIDFSGSAPLYIQVPWATGSPGTVLTQVQAPMSVSGTTYYSDNTTTPLSISAPLIGSGIGNIALFAATDDPRLPDGKVPVSGQMTITVTGDNPGLVRAIKDNQTTLFIRVEEVASSGLSMYMERPTAEMVPLSITSQITSGVFPVAISGAFGDNSSATLYIEAPTTNTLTTFTRGYSE